MKFYCNGREIELPLVSSEVSTCWIEPGIIELRFPSRVVRVAVAKSGDKRWLGYDGRCYVFETAHASQRVSSLPSDGVVTAPMPCLITKVAVAVGNPVVAGQEVVVFEAMKTVQTLAAPFNGMVKQVHVAERSLVQEGEKLVEIERVE